MPRPARTLLALACAAVPACLTVGLAPTTALAARTPVSSNWAGYAVTSIAGKRFARVSGSWVQPAPDCTSTAPGYSAFWVGLGGYARTSQALEQIGTEADCSASGGVAYRAWYELVPANSVRVPMQIRPGDQVSASVAVSGRKVTVTIADRTRGTSYSRRLRMSAPDVSSAEWIAEAPAACFAGGGCRTLPLANFGQVTFSAASATAGGHAGPISDPAWSPTAISLRDVRFGFGRGFDRFAGAGAVSGADPGALASTGDSFAVTWRSLRTAGGQGPVGLGPGGVGGGAPGV